MSPKNDITLVNKFPYLYRNRYASMSSTAMCWGFDVCDGWYDIIHDLSVVLEAEIVKMKDAGMPVDKLPTASQVKEKFGELRFYLSHGTDAMFDAVENAESLSMKTCEMCGAPGVSRGGIWIQTLCDEHAQEKK